APRASPAWTPSSAPATRSRRDPGWEARSTAGSIRRSGAGGRVTLRAESARPVRNNEAVTDVLDDLQWRGLIALSTDLDALRAALARGPTTFYCGFDPTGPSLHFGHLTQILTVRRVQQAGNLPLALVGGATGLIGDPRRGRWTARSGRATAGR